MTQSSTIRRSTRARPRPTRLCLALALAGIPLCSLALPDRPVITAGQVDVKQGGAGVMNIQQGTRNAAIDWQSFSIAVGERVNVQQPDATSVLLNRVVGSDPSLILGQLSSNGRVFLSNPRGILFGEHSRIDVGGLLATTLDLREDTQQPGRWRLGTPSGSLPAAIQADGNISAPGGTVVLVAPQVTVTGNIQARRVGLGAASRALVDVDGDGLIFFDVQNDGLDARLRMLGRIQADGGTVEARAQARAGFADTVLNLDGVVQARSIGQVTGRVLVDGGTTGVTSVSGVVDASGRAAGEQGGSVTVLGDRVGLVGTAMIDASGDAGGGQVRVGGGMHGEGTSHNASRVYVGPEATIAADALTLGSGGQATVWSDEVTRFGGQLSARGGAIGGDGGTAEISGKRLLDLTGRTDLRAPAGKMGNLLLDPLDIVIGTTAAVDGSTGDVTGNILFADFGTNTSQITASALGSLLGTTSVTLQANRDITVDSAVTASGPGGSLTMQAGRDINLNASITLVGRNLSLTAHDPGGNSFPNGGIALASGVQLSTGATSGNISLSGDTVLFVGGNSLAAGGNIGITVASGNLALPTVTAGGAVSATVDSGNITQTGAITTGADGSVFTTSQNNRTINLSNAGNSFGTHSVGFNTQGTNGNVTVTSDSLKLGTSGISGSLAATTSTGGITEAGALTIGSNGSSFTVPTLQSIDLGSQANSIAGAASAGIAFSGETNLSLRNIGNIQIGATTVPGFIALTSDAGNISQSGVLTTGADGSVFTTSQNNRTINLASSTNAFGSHSVAFSTAGASGDVSVASDALVLGTSSVGGKLTATATTGDIGQSGAVTTGATGSSFTVTAGKSINLGTQANHFANAAAGINFANATNLALRQAGDIQISATTVAGTISLTSDTGNITQGGVLSTGADGSLFTTSASGRTIDLSTSVNAFGGHTVAFSTSGGAGDVAVTSDSLLLAASTVGGKLTATAATGGIGQTGVITTGANGSVFTTSTAGQAIDLSTQANAFGSHSVGFATSGAAGDVAVRTDSLVLGASNIGGKLTATTTTGGIGQNGAVVTGATGSTFTVAAGQSINLGTQANSLAGAAAAGLAFNGETNLALRDVGDVQIGATTVAGTISLTSDTGNITQIGALGTGADGSLFTTSGAGKTIDLSTAANAFGAHSVRFATSGAAGDVRVTSDSLVLGASQVGGRLLATASTGNLSQAGAISTGADGSVFTTSAAGMTINLSTAANAFGSHSVAFATSGAGADVNVASDRLVLAASNIGGKLVASATAGGIAQTGAIVTGSAGSSFTAAGGQSIDLGTQANSIVGSASFSNAGDVAWRNAGDLTIGASSITGRLVLTSDTGNIGQTGALATGAGGSVFTTSAAGHAIDLSTQANAFGNHSVGFATSGATGNVSVRSDALVFGTSGIGGNLTATTTAGGIAQTGAIATGTTGSSFSVPAGQSIDLGTQPNTFASAPAGGLSFAGETNLSLRNVGDVSLGATTLTGSISLTSDTGNVSQTGAFATGADGSVFATLAAGKTIDLSTFTNTFGSHSVGFDTAGAAGDVAVRSDSLVLGTSVIGGKLSATTTTGGIGQTGAIATGATGSTFTVAAGQSIDLGTQSNNFASALAGSLVFSNEVNLALRNVGDISVAATSLAGKMSLISDAGNITQTGVLATGADGSFFATLGANKTIDLSTASNQFGTHSVAFSTTGASGNVGVVSDTLVLGTSNIGGRLTATATTGNISETGAIVTGAGGTSFNVTPGRSIDLGTQPNNLSGAVGFNGATNLAWRNVGDVQIAATTLPGSLSITSDAGNITQSGAIVTGGNGSVFSTLAAGRTIDLSTFTNTFGSHSVGFNTVAGDVAVRSDSLVFGTSAVGGTLNAVATTGTITQSGAIATGADGSQFSTLTAGQGINLGVLTNLFGGHSVGVVTTGPGADAQLKSDSLALAASSVGGRLVAVTTAGNLSQTGVLSVGADNSLFSTTGANSSIDLSTSTNLFGAHAVQFSTLGPTGNVRVRSDTLVLGSSTIGGSLTATTTVGDITEAGAVSTGAPGSSFTLAAGRSVDLSTQANQFFDAAFNNATNVSLRNVGGVRLGATTLPGRMVVISDSGNISQDGAIATGAGGSTFTTSTPNRTIDLSTSLNHFGTNTVAFSTSGPAGDVKVSSDSLRLAASGVGGNFDATASAGDMTQVGALVVGGTASLDAGAGTVNVTFTDPGNRIAVAALNPTGAGQLGAVQLVTAAGMTVGGDAASLQVTAGGPLVLAAGRYGSLTLNRATAVSQSAAVSVTGTTQITPGAVGTSIDLATNGAANELNRVSLVGAPGASFGTVAINDRDRTRVDGLLVDGDAARLVADTGGALFLGGGSYGALDVGAAAAIVQAAAVSVSGIATVRATGVGVTADLTAAGNSLPTVVLGSGAGGSFGQASVATSGALSVTGDAATLSATAGSTLTLGGGNYTNLNATASGLIGQSGALSVSGTATLVANAPGMGADLSTNGAANELASVVLANGTGSFGAVSLHDRDQSRTDGLRASGQAASLAVTTGGALALGAGAWGQLLVDTSAGNGAVTQSAALNVAGLLRLNTGLGDITLGRSDNSFNDTAIVSAGNARLAGAGGFRVGTSQVAGSLTLDSSGTVHLTGVVSGAGSVAKEGTGTLLIDSAQAWGGTTDVRAGTLSLQGPTASIGAGALTLEAGSVLALGGGVSFGRPLSSQGGTVSVAAGDHAGVTGAFTLGATTTLDVGSGSTLALTGAISGSSAAGLTMTGSGTALIAATNTSSGPTTVQQGTLRLGTADAVSPTSAVQVAAGATLDVAANVSLGSLSGAGSVTLENAQVQIGALNADTTFGGVIGGTGDVSKTGTGTLTLSGNNSYSGATRIDAGVLATGAAGVIPDASAVQIAAPGTFRLGADETVGSLAGAGQVDLQAHRLTVGIDGTSTTFSGSLVGSGGLTKSGTGTLTLAGTSSYGGLTDLTQGSLALVSSASVPADSDLTVQAGTTLTVQAPIALGALTGTGTVAIGGTTFGIGAHDATAQFDGAIRGSGTLRKVGTGTVTLAGISDFTGTTAVDAGTLAITGSFSGDTGLVIASPGTLSLGADQRFANLAGSGSVALGNSRLTVGDDNTDTTFSGTLTGAGALTKAGTGTLILAGDNSHSGGTTIAAGTLQLGAGGAAGTAGTGVIVDNGTLRIRRGDAFTLDVAVTGSGAVEVAQGTITLSAPGNAWTGPTRVLGGELHTSGAERLPDGTVVTVAQGASLTFGGSETVGSISADGAVATQGSITTSGDQAYRGGVTFASAGSLTLTGAAIDAGHAGNDLGTGLVSVNANRLELAAAPGASLRLGNVSLAQGGDITAGRLSLEGNLQLSGGTLSLVSDAAPDPARAQLAGTTRVSPSGNFVAWTEDTVTQGAGSTISVATGATLKVAATGGGSIALLQDANQFNGTLSLLSGPAFDTAWDPVLAGTLAMVGRVRIAGDVINIGAEGVEADAVDIRANRLMTSGGAAIVARMPFDNLLLGTSASEPGMILELAPGAFPLTTPFGTGDGPLNVVVGSRTTGNRTTGPDAGYLRVLPKGGAQGATAVYLAGPKLGSGSGYAFFNDGVGKQTEIPVFYNGVLPQTPQVIGSLSAVASVAESARRDRFEEAVRTENVTVRLRSGVIAEVGPGRPATVGTEGAAMPPQCAPAAGSLACAGK